MKVELIKRMMDACYLAKRARDMLPPLPEGVMPSYIQYLDALQKLEAQGMLVRVSDLSEALGLPRPGVTRTVKEMEAKGYLKKTAPAEDGRVTYLSITEAGAQLSQTYDKQFFDALVPCLQGVPEADVETTIRTIEAFHQVFCERRTSLEI